MSPAVSVVIVNYNAGAHLAACLRSLAAHLPAGAWEAVVVDNASIDGSERAAEQAGPAVRLLQQATNLGFGRGVNIGVRDTAAPHVLLVNPDAEIGAGAYEAMAAELSAHPACAIVGPRVVNTDGSEQGSVRGDPDMVTGVFGRSSTLTRWFPGASVARRNVPTSLEPPDGTRSMAVDWVSGSCMLVRRDAFDAVDGFDTRYFMYWEDADLCRRLRAAGWHVRYCPGARVTHAVGQSSRTAPAASIRAFHRSAYLYYVTHVARSPWSPRRWAAAVLLALRAAWKLLWRHAS